ncbi:MAG TPA: zinc-binding dehydrogenase [Dongiaceae bacterium]|nr:zinc-binding dehydrogenase [Dongiaceae bacterium]
MSRPTMQVARLHGIRDLRVERIPVPEPGPGELLVEVEACGVCATDARKFEVGVNDGHYPFNPGHEWVGRVAALGAGVSGWRPGERIYGDTYGGYADFAVIPVDPIPWSRGPVRLPDSLPLERAVFLEPLADCLHAVHDQARLSPGEQALVIAAGAMGLKIIAAAARLGARVMAVEPLQARRRLALDFGAEQAVAAEGWPAEAQRWSEGRGVDAVILTIGEGSLLAPALGACKPGARVVLFAGFGNRPDATIDLNLIHYREIQLVGSEWVGTPPNQRRERYDQAAKLLVEGALPVERLVTGHCGFSDLGRVLAERGRLGGIKTVFRPKEAS